MTRYFLSCLTLFACLACLPGCGGGGGGPAQFDASKVTPQTPEEIQAEKDYAKTMEEQQKQMAQQSGQ